MIKIVILLHGTLAAFDVDMHVHECKDAELLLFADDTNVFLYDTDIYQLMVRANKALSDINNWIKLIKLSVNVKNVILYYSLLNQLQLILK